MERNNDFGEISYKLMKIFVFFIVVVLYFTSMYMNYDSNKRFDKLFIFENRDLGIYKGFKFNDEAKDEPILFWRWSCDITRSQKYYLCDHCPLIGECSQHTFELYELSKEELINKQYLNRKRDDVQSNIKILSLILIFIVLAYWIAQWKYDRENWERTPLARWIKKIKGVDNNETDKE